MATGYVDRWRECRFDSDGPRASVEVIRRYEDGHERLFVLDVPGGEEGLKQRARDRGADEWGNQDVTEALGIEAWARPVVPADPMDDDVKG